MNTKKIITIAILISGQLGLQATVWSQDEAPVLRAGTVRPPLLTTARPRPGVFFAQRQDPLASNRALANPAPAASEVHKDVSDWFVNVPESLLD